MNTLSINQPIINKNSFPKDLICFSHLRWDFVYQRPQHLLSRFARCLRVFFIEEPIFGAESDTLKTSLNADNVWVVIPYLRHHLSAAEITSIQRDLITGFFSKKKIEDYIFWYYTPMALSISEQFKPAAIVYDCMDELSAFKFAPASLKDNERRLMEKADVVFTGGHSLYEAKKDAHHNIHPFPSSIDKEHFAAARKTINAPADQAAIPHPRIGFFGVIDERLNIELIARVAEKRKDWHFVIVGPVVKIDPNSLPKNINIHYLGGKSYQELPSYLAGWDIAMIPFALNESTRFISPTKTPEYLSAGKPVISTSIRDVVRPYGNEKLVHIADTDDEFIACAEKELKTSGKKNWLKKVDTFLAGNSWHNTWKKMYGLIENVIAEKLQHVALENKPVLHIGSKVPGSATKAQVISLPAIAEKEVYIMLKDKGRSINL